MAIRRRTWAGISILAAVAASWTWSPSVEAQPKAADAQAVIKRGDYLVNQIARCGDCHTPRDARGRLDMTRHLRGAKMWFAPKDNAKEWSDKAPDITVAGKAGKWTEAKMIKFLSTGGDSDPPMPAYKMTVEDAQAVTAYLRSLRGDGKAVGRKREREDDD
jgi:mono/diheme cytochrome c family protein